MVDEPTPEPPDNRPEPLPADETYPIAPPVQRSVEPEPLVSVDLERLDEPPPNPERLQFSLKEMLVLMTIAAVGLSVLGMIPGGYTAPHAAGLTGLAVLVGLIVVLVVKPERMIVHVAWWLLFFAYLAACVVAVLRNR